MSEHENHSADTATELSSGKIAVRQYPIKLGKLIPLCILVILSF